MRLVILVIVCSVLTVGGFFGYKQYERAQTRDDAMVFVMRSVDQHAEQYGQEAKDGVVRYMNKHRRDAFNAHYNSGGLRQPAEFDEIGFMRDLFQRVRDDAQQDSVSEQTKAFAQYLYIRSRPLD